MFDTLKTKTGPAVGAAKQALQLDAASVVVKLVAQLADRQAALENVDSTFSAALKAEAHGEPGAGVSAARKALQQATEALADTQRALADARQDAVAEQAAAAAQATADAWENCDRLQAECDLEAGKLEAAAVALAEAFQAVLDRQTDLLKAIPEASHDFRLQLAGGATASAVIARLRVLCPLLVGGGHSLGGLHVPTVDAAVRTLYDAICYHHRKTA